MVNIKQRLYAWAIITLVLSLLACGIWLWTLWDREYRHQNKVYSGAKLVSGEIAQKRCKLDTMRIGKDDVK